MTEDRAKPSIDVVAALYADGWSMARIAVKFGYSSGAVRKWMDAAGIERRPAGGDHGRSATVVADPGEVALVDELCRLYTVEQLALVDIGRRYGHTAEWVRPRLERRGVMIRTTTFAAEVVPAAVIEEMTRLYVDDHKTTIEIGEQFGRARSWVARHLEAAGVQLKTGGARRLDVDENRILQQYVDQAHSMSAIARDLGVGLTVVRRVLAAHGVRIRGRRESNTVIDGDELRRLYVDEGLTTGEIAERISMSSSAVGAALQRHQIPIRRGLPLTISSEQLQQHLDDGLTNAEIANLHDVATYAVTLRLRAEQLRRPPATPTWTKPTPARRALHELYVDQELSLADIAVQYGVPHATVIRWLDKNGIDRRPRAYTVNPDPGHQLDIETIRALYVDEEWTAAEIGRHIGVTKKIILDHLHRHGVPLRPSGAKRPGTDRALLDRLYGDVDIVGTLHDNGVPIAETPGRLRDRFPKPGPLTARLVGDLYNQIGLSVSQISLVTGHFDVAVRRALQQARIPARDGSLRSPWIARSSGADRAWGTTEQGSDDDPCRVLKGVRA